MWGMETTGLLISAVLMSLPQVASNPASNLQTTNHTLTTYPVILTEHALCVCVCVCVWESDSQKFYLIPICVVSGTMILDRSHVNLHAIQN